MLVDLINDPVILAALIIIVPVIGIMIYALPRLKD